MYLKKKFYSWYNTNKKKQNSWEIDTLYIEPIWLEKVNI